jgi:hypothetical protein
LSWAALWVAQIAISTAVWNVIDPHGSGWPGLVLGAVFLVPAVALWRARSSFRMGSG